MSKVDDVYLAIVDDEAKELDTYKFSSREELRKKIEDIEYEYTSNIESAIDEIEYDYAENHDLHWEDE